MECSLNSLINVFTKQRMPFAWTVPSDICTDFTSTATHSINLLNIFRRLSFLAEVFGIEGLLC